MILKNIKVDFYRIHQSFINSQAKTSCSHSSFNPSVCEVLLGYQCIILNLSLKKDSADNKH